VLRALEQIDLMVGELRDAIRAEDARAAVCIVSDHGFAPVNKVLWLDAIFVRERLITLKTKETTVQKSGVTDWVARPWHAGGSAAIMLKNPGDGAARARVKSLLERLHADPENGIEAILDEAAIRRLGGDPAAQFWVTMRAGHMVSATLQPSIVSVVSARGTHGYAPTLPEVASTFIIAGDGIAAGRDLGSIDMRSIAPTLARFMAVPFPSAEVPAVDIFSTTK
jgi:predicted AlkP superfamily pyrophosphatase or phosphodiesterase